MRNAKEVFQRFSWNSDGGLEAQDQEAAEAQRVRELRSKEALEQEAEIQRKRSLDNMAGFQPREPGSHTQ